MARRGRSACGSRTKTDHHARVGGDLDRTAEDGSRGVDDSDTSERPDASAVDSATLDGGWDALTRFIDDPLVPIDNAPTEREFQNFAKLRLNMLFAGSTEGAHRACVLLGVVATCRAIGVPAQEYLAWAFERLGTHRDHFGLALEQITPAAFKATRG